MVGTIHWMEIEIQLHRDWKSSSSDRDVCPRAGAWEGDVPGKETALGRCGHREGDVPQDAVPREETFSGRCSQEAKIFGKEMSLGRCNPLEGNISRKDIPGKVSMGR